MLLILSPAKTLDLSPAPADLPLTRPELAADARRLVSAARRLKAADLKRLMDISDALAELNVARFRAFRSEAAESDPPAVLMFAGDVYAGLDARSWSREDLVHAQDRLRILSGLYGVLRPLDRVQPYRLEMGVRLATDRGATLYDYWGDKPARLLTRAVRDHADPTVVNLASHEYFGAVDARALKTPVVSCAFHEVKDGRGRILSFFAKRARGLMARFAVLNRVDRAEGLKDFDLEGYRYDPAASGEREWVFSRPQPEPKAARTVHGEETYA